MSKVWNAALASAGSLALLACGGGDTPAPRGQDAAAVTPVGGEGRPTTLAEATAGESDVALWSLHDEDTTVYLLGTIHLMEPGVDWKTDAIDRAFDEADAVYLEADVLSPEARKAMDVLVTERAGNPEGVTLSSYYDEEEQARINEDLGRYGLELSQLDRFRPWFAALQVGMLAMINAGGDPASGADVVISRDMLERGIPLRYLETATQQISIMAAGEDRRQAEYFLDMLDDLEEGEAYFADLMGAWYEGDVERLDFLMNDAFEGHPELRERLLTARNEDWAGQIDRLMADEPGTFVMAVGSGHLAGPDSVQAQLGELGHETVRVGAGPERR